MIIDEELQGVRLEKFQLINLEKLRHADLIIGVSHASHAAHTLFDRNIWKNLPSFHNYDHIRAVHEEMENYFTHLRNNPADSDPLRIRESITKWNEDHPDHKITLDQLELAMSLAIQCHDLGNFMRSGEASEDVAAIDGQKIKYTFLSKYRSGKIAYLEGEQAEETAEDRSIRIAKFLLHRRDLLPTTTTPTQALPAYLEPLVCHLIDETRYAFSPERGGNQSPFAIAMRVFDQIGNYIHNFNPISLVGLMIELVLENPYKKFNPHQFANFAFYRLKELLPNKSSLDDFMERHKIDFSLINLGYFGFIFEDKEIDIIDWLMQNLDQLGEIQGINMTTLIRSLERCLPDRFSPRAV
jgi:hypothetical protein